MGEEVVSDMSDRAGVRARRRARSLARLLARERLAGRILSVRLCCVRACVLVHSVRTCEFACRMDARQPRPDTRLHAREP